MRKIISLILIFCILILACGCSRETKMGIGEYSDRIQKDFGLVLDEKSILLEKNGENSTVYCNINSFLFVFYLGNSNNIRGLAGILPKEKESELSSFLDSFKKCVSVFTLNSPDDTSRALEDCKISAESIKFTDGNKLNTVGKFQYSVITNESSVTVFCERV